MALWNMLDSKAKLKIIAEYIDTIEIEKHTNSETKDINITIKKINFKLNKVSHFFSMSNNRLVEATFHSMSNDNRISVDIVKNIEEAEKYIKKLRKNYPIKVKRIYEKDLPLKYIYDPKTFKIIVIPAKKAIQHRQYVYLAI